MDTTYNIRDFILNSLPLITRHEFLADVNEILKDVSSVDEQMARMGEAGKKLLGDRNLATVQELHNAWSAFSQRRTVDEQVEAFAIRWYRDMPHSVQMANFVLRNLHAAKRLGYCVTDGKLF